MNPLTLVGESLFFALLTLTLLGFVRRRGPLAADVVLLFAALAAFFMIQLARELWPEAGDGLRLVGRAALLLPPGLSLRLTSHFRPLPAWALPAALVGYAAAMAAVIGLGPTHPLSWLLIAANFVAGIGATIFILTQEAARRAGSARWRLSAASGAMALLVLGIVAAAAGGAIGESVARAVAVIAAVAFLLAFAPPDWLRHFGRQAVAYRFLVDLAALEPGAGTARLWQHLVEAARGLTGALSCEVRLGDDAGAPAVAAGGVTGEGEPAPTVVRFGGGSQRAALYLWTRGVALFAEDDLELLELLGVQTLAAVERETVLAERSAMAERLAAANVELTRMSAAKSDFLAAMSHELRTPLNAIIGFSELLLTPLDGRRPAAGDVREFASHIHGAGLHLLELINDILDLSKVEAGRLELRHEPIDVATLLSETLATVRPLAEAKRLSIEVAELAPLVAEVDAARLRQITYNLLSNAIKFTPPEGRVRVALAADDEMFDLAVSDTGPGIALADQERIFAAFEQLTPGAVEGTGLGLALTRRLVEAHGGQIELTSTPGSGSRFSVRLPLRRVAAAEPTAVEPEAGTGPLVLIVEDDAPAAELLRLQLRQAGYRVALAGDGESGVQAAQQLAPAAILLDILLPGLDGWEVLRRLRADPSTSPIPVMVITIVDNEAFGLGLGAVDYFVKPVSRETLLAALGRFTLTTKVRERTVTVLTIDDDPAALALYRESLTPEGFRVIEAASGKDGLAQARSGSVDMIVLDILLPDLDGFEVAARLKADPATSAIPILVVTGHPLSDDDKARLNEHALAVLAKGDEAMNGLRAWLEQVSQQ